MDPEGQKPSQGLCLTKLPSEDATTIYCAQSTFMGCHLQSPHA